MDLYSKKIQMRQINYKKFIREAAKTRVPYQKRFRKWDWKEMVYTSRGPKAFFRTQPGILKMIGRLDKISLKNLLHFLYPVRTHKGFDNFSISKKHQRRKIYQPVSHGNRQKLGRVQLKEFDPVPGLLGHLQESLLLELNRGAPWRLKVDQNRFLTGQNLGFPIFYGDGLERCHF